MNAHKNAPLSKTFREYNNVQANCRHVISPYIEALRTPEELEKGLAFSKRPFADIRGAKEVALYNAQQNKKRRARNTIYQYERYKAALGEDAPKAWPRKQN